MTLQPRDTSTTCYSMLGLKSPFDAITYIPCNLTAIENGQHSACCAEGDLCLTNGLCKFNGDSKPANFNEYWRVACTDPTYEDDACPKQCANIERNDKTLPTHLVFQCPGDGKWCCATGHIDDFPKRGTVNTTCCDIDDLAFDDKAAVVYTTASISLDVKTSIESRTSTSSKSTKTSDASASASTTSTSFSTDAIAFASESAPLIQSSTSSSSTPTSTAQASSSNSHSIALGVGFGLGIPVVVSFLIAIAFLCSRWRRNRRARGERLGPESHEDVRRRYPHAFWVEPGGRELPVELEASKEPVEVWTPTSSGKEWEKEWQGDGPRSPNHVWANEGLPRSADNAWTAERLPRSPEEAWVRERDKEMVWNGGAETYR